MQTWRRDVSATVCLIVWDPGETTAGKAADAEQEVTQVDLMQIADGMELAQLVHLASVEALHLGWMLQCSLHCLQWLTMY